MVAEDGGEKVKVERVGVSIVFLFVVVLAVGMGLGDILSMRGVVGRLLGQNVLICCRCGWRSCVEIRQPLCRSTDLKAPCSTVVLCRAGYAVSHCSSS